MGATSIPHDLASCAPARTIAQLKETRRMNALPPTLRRPARLAVALLFGAAVSMPALAQWAWKDASGRTVFSDQPPPASVKKEQIVRQPANSVLSAPPAPAAGAAKATAPTAPKTLAEREQEYRKRQLDRAEAEKKQADEQALAARRQQECNRARGYLRQLEDGIRIARTDAQGNREILDDAQRAAETARAREVIQATCD
jgi:hypothetical protein